MDPRNEGMPQKQILPCDLEWEGQRARMVPVRSNHRANALEMAGIFKAEGSRIGSSTLQCKNL